MAPSRPALAAILAGLTCLGPSARAQDAPPAPPARHGGSLLAGHFRLSAHDGATVESDDLAGRPYALFFGFTHCPDVCPTALAELSLALQRLPPRTLPVYFVSVDPERDTPEVLRRYMESFDPGIVGLSGSRMAVDEAILSFGIVARRTDLPGGGYTYGHTAAIFLVDGDGLIVDRLGSGLGPTALAARLAALAGPASPPADARR
ncbi:SCO family protein [Methylobacterium nonmethylotrophicum]|uniref:SCO family protein n=1 Tax=Methylobacterium nonmethylotrophicum TaxID=1141884 RepID=A0A4Z0NVZ1_9HYPH|nr:SCO family protein [Methylobacterium nonmethylotrophicum]TGE01242.1 SCO family protein [Methylobacterium nonmethylotrophicum]